MADDQRYVLSKKIARGGMAEIFLGKHVGEDGFERVCAIKRILPHYAQDQEFVQMFRDEAHICKRLVHGNIVRVEGFEEVDGSYAIIMEYVKGADLRTLLHAVEQAKIKMPIALACYIIAETARGLHYAHTKIDEITQQRLGIVHRDISPQNILISVFGEVKVTDFGIADAESKITETRPGIVKGKYSYMSPEQISAKEVDARTDVFALSVVLWEMLAMKRLFQGENEVDTIQKVKNCKIDQDLRQLNPDVDPELEEIVRRGLAKDFKKRTKSADQLEVELRRFLSKKYPEYTPQDLGNFLKENLESKIAELSQDIKKTLTESNQKPARKAGVKKRSVDAAPEEDLANMPSIAVAKPAITRSAMNSPLQTNQPRTLSRPAFGTRTTFTRNTGLTNHAAIASSRTSSSSSKLWFLTLIACVAILGGSLGYVKFRADAPGTITIRTQPPWVKISIDGTPLNRNQYVRASTVSKPKVTLNPGKHVLTVTREGYIPYEYKFSLDRGEQHVKDDIVLKENGVLGAVKIKLKQSNKSARIVINNGYFVGQFVPGKINSISPDVMQGKSYRMKIITGSDQDFYCRFTPKSTSWRTPNEIVIDVKMRRCTMSGG
jgi:serine/threonine protein kinase